MILPPEALPLLEAFGPLFTLPTYRHFVVLLAPPSSPGAATPSPTCCGPSGPSPRGIAPITGESSPGLHARVSSPTGWPMARAEAFPRAWTRRTTGRHSRP
ncbi:hypothetical protein [Singulisphaera sp. PoT]|uniref:hypothetical protein n=1 Tax=Singulisphaera sp. PoT TaxID=3411797 RepID=UPI003BF50C86